MPVTKTKTFSGRVERVVHVATVNDVNLMLYGVLLSGEPEWLRICTTEIKQAEKIAFLSPDAHVKGFCNTMHGNSFEH
ncbi:hypothetical protein [Pantoea dispersa]|uniref:hypothetical protein n=1 Tax=Pantoea dispersa TaxID=59814 RepID=UPI0039BDB4D0